MQTNLQEATLALDSFKPIKQRLPNYEGKLLVALGLIFLLMIIIVVTTGSWLILRNNKAERIRLGSTVTYVVSHSINKVSFSGKYHARLLVENMAKTNPEISYIIVLDNSGHIFAHSDPAMNDKLAADAGAAAAKQILDGRLKVTQELIIKGESITEFAEPFTGGYGNKLMGVVRVGISKESSQKAQRESFFYIFILVVLLIIISLVAIFRISRFFAAPVNNMALTLKGIMANAPMAIFIQNSDHILVETNNNFIQTFGLAPHFLGKTSVQEALPDSFTEECKKIDDTVFHSGKANQREMSLVTKKGQRTFMVNKFPVAVNRNGQIEEVCTFLLDITETHQLEEQLRHSQKMEAVGHLAGGIAHDFNNLLTGIIGYADLTMLIADENPDIKQNMTDLLQAANRAAELTTGLLAFSRKQLLDPKTITLENVVRRMESLLLNVVGETIELHIVERADEPILVRADEPQIGQVLLNLLANARDAMPDGGSITISFTQMIVGANDPAVGSLLEPGSYGVLTVEDTGCGMNPKVLNNIFEPFFTTKPKGKGTGLGLSTAYGIIKQHQGEIIVNSTEGHGTTFNIYLPTGVQKSEKKQQERPNNHVSPGGKETILLVEDEPLVRQMLEVIIMQSGYNVITAQDGLDAFKKFEESKDSIHLILMDVVMPHMNGREALEKIRTIVPNMRCIFMSGYTAEILAQDNILRGKYDFLPKPVRRENLLKIIREVLER